MEELYETQRLIIRRWKEADVFDLYEYCSNPEATRYLPFPAYKSMDDAFARYEDMKNLYAEYDRGDTSAKIDFAIELKSERKVIGSIGFVNYSANADGIIEVGYLLNPLYHGNGYMTETLKGMFRYIKDNRLAMRIEAKHDFENTASGRVMQRTGMTFEGIRRKSGDNNKNKRADMFCYSILYEEIAD